MHSTFTLSGSCLPHALFLLLVCFGPFSPGNLGATASASGAIVRVENMTKVPGTNRGFPAEDFFTFHRILNPINTKGAQLLTADRNKMRIHNDGTGTLKITKLTSTNTANFTITGARIPSGGLLIEPGNYITVTVNFVTDYGQAKRLVTDKLVMDSNADNAAKVNVTFRGAYMNKPEGGFEIDAQKVFASFGFQTEMGKDQYGNYIVRPSSDFPTEADVNAGKHGDLILSRWFEQADPKKPMRAFQLAAFHGPGQVKTELRGDRNVLLNDMVFVHGSAYHQSLLSRTTDASSEIAGKYTSRLDGRFKINIAGFTTLGGTPSGTLRDEILAIRVYRVIDHNGRTVPNEYIALMDYIGTGCGEGSSNCDWNDNAIYIINARPEGVPTGLEIPNLTVQAGKPAEMTVNGAFDRGYPGNAFTYSASLAGGGTLPTWVKFDKTTGTFAMVAPSGAVGNLYEIEVTAKDYNGLTARATFALVVDNAALSCSVNANTSGTGKVLDCTDGRVRLSGFTSTGTYRWSGPNGFTSTAQQPTVSKPGIYKLAAGSNCDRISVVEVFADPNCESGTASNTAPVADASASTLTGDAPLTVTLDATASRDPDGSIVEYAWTWPGNTAAGPTPELVLDEGTYKITLTVRDNRGKSATDVVTITVNPEPVPRATNFWLEAECASVGSNWITANSGAASGGKYVVSEKSSTGSRPEDVPANRVRFTINDVEQGPYYLLARVLSPDVNSDSYWVRVNGQSWFEWKRDIDPGTGFQWNLYSGNSFPSLKEGTNTIDFAFREAGTQLDKLLISRLNTLPTGQGEAAGNCGTVANQPPVARATASATSGVAPLTLTLDGGTSTDPDGSIVSYNWKWSGGSGSGKQQVVTLGAGNYAITLTVKDDDGATASKVVNVAVTAEPAAGENEFWLEAECAIVGSKWSVGAAGAASNGSYVVVKSGNSYNSPPTDVASNRIRFSVNTSAAGSYRLFARVLAASGLDDSFYLRVNGGSWYSWSRGLSGDDGFVWREYPRGTVNLREGTNTIDIAYREDGTQLDKLFLTTATTVPQGLGGVDDSCEDVADDGSDQWLEIECGDVGAGWSTVSGGGASNGTYIVYNGTRNIEDPRTAPADERAAYSFDIATAGDYHLFLRLSAPDFGKNSLWIKVDDYSWIEMWKEVGDEKLITNGFEWRKVNDDGVDLTFSLGVGQHTIEVANRESGTMLDKLKLSLSPTLPVGEGTAATNCASAQLMRFTPDREPVAQKLQETPGSLEVFPNPVGDELNLRYAAPYVGWVDLTIFDVNGRTVAKLQREKPGQQLNVPIDVGHLAPGMYHVRVVGSGLPTVLPFIKR
ncbi:putative secreted protein (Por secretion system target) [Neolewinella xylanilytica]|uniref:Putative secreted protein (Por secretion system target) n=1 Tax=Neolewinella xylanilytica TaxID=1514080 RepID=A0A2S6IAK3_9BACT|nr:PKD domain-containing protein [Neolewinella xylanilytica]PPK88534.1 putative secreted protein (Por secretion system target) [Neolewinella xylanilytica]